MRTPTPRPIAASAVALDPICLPRRGIPGGALGATARLMGSVSQHLREAHPDATAESMRAQLRQEADRG